jgi:hypothetical protein
MVDVVLGSLRDELSYTRFTRKSARVGMNV